MKTFARSLTILSCLAIVSFLAACIPAAPSAPAGGAAPQGGEQAAAPAEGEKITLRFANIFDATGMEVWQPLIDQYEAENPTIEIAAESTAGSGAAIYPDVLKTSIASGNPPDFFFMWGGEVAGPFIDAGQVLDLTSYYEQYGWGERFSPWTIDRITVPMASFGGVPFKAMGMGFWYQKSMLEELGLSVPTTFAEQEELCATLKENDIYCITVGGKFGWHTMRILDYFLELTCGAELHDQLNRLEASWDSTCVVEAYATFQRWIDNGWVVPDFLTVAPDEARFPWYQGDAALILEGVWYEDVLKNDEQDTTNFDFYLPPTDHDPVRFSTFPEQFMITADSAHPDEAAKFLNWITDPARQNENIAIFANSAVIGVNPDCNAWPLTCRWRELITTAESTYPPTDQAFVKELMDGFFEVQDGIVAKKYTPEEGAQLMQQRVEEWQAKQ